MSVVIEGEGSTLLVLGHGAGASMDSKFMAFVSDRIATGGVAVARFNFRYMEGGRRSPDRASVLEETFRAVVDGLRERSAPDRLYLGGKSMGGRIASQIVAAGCMADGLVFLGYPLHPPGKPEKLRDAHLHDISVPMLFVEGTRDPFCPLRTLERVLANLDAPADLVVIEGGDHSLKVPKSSGRTTEEALTEAAAAVTNWIISR